MSKPKEGHKNEFVTMSILKDMMELQDKGYKFTVKTFTDQIKAEIKEIRKEVEDLKLSVNFVSANHDDFKTQLGKIDDEIRGVYRQVEGLNTNLNDGLEDMEWKHEYLENQSRRNNIKITGVVEDNNEKTWDDTEATVKKLIKEKLGINEDVEIERAHRFGKRLKNHAPRRHLGSTSKPTGRPIIVKFQLWKVKENILKQARRKRPKDVQFLNDYAKRTLERRAERIPKMLEACRNGKTAFMVMDKVIIYDKPPGKFDSIPTHQDINEDDEVIINDRYK